MAEVITTSHAAPGSNAILVDSPYKVDWVRAVGAGIPAALALLGMHFFIWWGYGANSLNLPLIFGSFLTHDYVMAQVLGLVATVLFYVVFALAYAYLLWVFRMQSNAGKGTIYGFLIFVPTYAFILPWTIGLAARWGLPQIDSTLVSSGYMMSSLVPNVDVMMNQAGQGNVGWEAVSLVALEHLLFGLLVGAVYRHIELPIGERYRLRYLGD
jgi:hypothetical protein